MKDDLLINDILRSLEGVMLRFDSYYGVKRMHKGLVRFDKKR